MATAPPNAALPQGLLPERAASNGSPRAAGTPAPRPRTIAPFAGGTIGSAPSAMAPGPGVWFQPQSPAACASPRWPRGQLIPAASPLEQRPTVGGITAGE